MATEIEPEIELSIGGTYTDITEDAYFTAGVTSTVGASSEGGQAESTIVGMQLKSPNGKYVSRNPLSPYFGLIGRNSPFRLSVGNADTVLNLPEGAANAYAVTPDAASLDITGDIDLRADISPVTWKGSFDGTFAEIASKYITAGDQRSWGLLWRQDGLLSFSWSPNGTFASLLSSLSTAPVPFDTNRRGAVRVTLDVNNGAGGNTTTFYTAPTNAGPWTQLGDPVVKVGATSIFSSTATVRVGDGSALTSESGLQMSVHAFEMRSGIAGSVVANPDFTAQAPGTTSFADGAGRTWSLAGGATITDRRQRFVVESSEWSPRWTVGADDVATPIVGGGVIRRLTQGERSLESTLRRRVPTDPAMAAYWPMEDGENASTAFSPIAGVSPLRMSRQEFGADGTLGGSRALPSIEAGGIMLGIIPPASSSSETAFTVQMVYRHTGTRPTVDTEFLSFLSSGTQRRWTILLRDGVATVRSYDGAGTLVINQSAAVGDDVWDGWNRFRFTVSEVAGTVNWNLQFINIGGSGGSLGNSFAGTAGRATAINTNIGSGLLSDSTLVVGHISAIQSVTSDPYQLADHGFTGERAGDRMIRLCEEESVPFRHIGRIVPTTKMGPQVAAPLTELLRLCERADGGILHEDVYRVGIAYRTRESMYAQEPAVTLSYSQIVQPLEPVDDDALTRNDITRSRPEGSSARVVQNDGPLSVRLPTDSPPGVGQYADDQEVSVELDIQLEQIAAWARHKGTWDEARYRKITILLHNHPEVIPEITEMRLGDLIRITDTPDFLPPGPIDLIVEGFSEDITGLTWTIVLNCSPGGVWSANRLEDAGIGRADTAGSELLLAVDQDDTLVVVETTRGPHWITNLTHPSMFPFSVTAGGEEMQVTQIEGAAEDTFTRVVANGWGTTDDGRTWTSTGGLAANRSVNGTNGIITIPATPTTWRIQRVGLVLADCETLTQFSMPQVHTGGAYEYCSMLRWVSDTDFYVVRATFNTTGSVQMRVFTNADGTIGATVTTPWTYAAGREFYMRSRVDGNVIRGKIWPVGFHEPKEWNVERTAVTTPNATGDVGLLCFADAGITSASPWSATTNFAVTTPQIFTVTRSVNGIIKSHAAATPLSLTTPMRVVL